ncbi:MAG: hypothetical protein V3575_00260 [Candidatus Absconditabacteria bacterium]
MTQKGKTNKESGLLGVEQSENLISGNEKAILKKLKESTNMERIKELEKKAETLDLAEKFSVKLENEGFINYNNLKDAFSSIFSIKKMQLYSIESGLLCFIKGDFMKPKDLKKLESNLPKLNKENSYLKVGEDHYYLLGNQILSIKGKQKNNDNMTSSILNLFKGTIILAAQNINEKTFKNQIQ